MKKSIIFMALAVFTVLPNCSCDQETYSRQSRPVISVNPLELDFGNVPLESQATRALDILNAGQIALEISDINNSNPDAPFFILETEISVGPESNQMLMVSFTPTEEGDFETEITFDSNSNNDSPTVIIKGTGVSDQECAPCGSPPDSYCLDEFTLVYYDMIGECVNSECLYRANTFFCEDGCDPVTGTCLERDPFCGDGIIDTEDGEECDDGANNSNVTADACRGNCMLPTCGDLVIDTGEICDDGNLEGGDGCRDDCTKEICGDGIIDPREICDDGNNINGDGCRADCTEERCGNGVPDVGEACDDGNASIGDGCRPDCTEEICGDGIVDPGEACDDGDTDETDGCNNDCTTDTCGNGILDDGEACDDGNTINGDGCRADCTNEVCGDGILDSGEECDDGNAVDGDGCTSLCVTEATEQPPLCVPTPDCCGTDCAHEWPLILNAGFEQLGPDNKPTDWTYMLDRCGQPGNPDPPCAGFPSIETEDNYGNVFQLSRPQQTGSGRWDFIGQTRTDFWDVSNCEEVLFTSDAKPMLQSLAGGGHYNNEFPIIYRVFYVADEPDSDGDGLPDSWELVKYNTDPNMADTDEDGTLDGDEDSNNNGRINIEENRYWRFQYGVYFNGGEPETIEGPPVDWSHGVQSVDVQVTKTDQATWASIGPIDLMTLNPKPKKIYSLRVGSAGWQYEGRWDNVQLTARAPICEEEPTP